MTFAEFQKSVSSGKLPPVIIFHGEEPYLARLGVELLRRNALTPGSEAFDFVSLTGRETTAEAIVAEAATVPMLSPVRLTVVYEFEKMSPSERTKLLAYVKAPVEGSCVALVSFERLTSRNKFERDVLSHAAVVDCGRLSRDSLLAVARRMADERGLTVDDDALAVLVDWVDGELNRVANELGKLACYVRSPGTARMADVEFVVGARASGLRDLALAIAERRPGASLSLFEELVDNGADAAQLVSQLYGLWTALWSMRAGQGGRAQGWPGSGAYLLEGAANLRELAALRTSRDYARGIESFYRADTDIRRGMPADATVGLLVFELAGLGN